MANGKKSKTNGVKRQNGKSAGGKKRKSNGGRSNALAKFGRASTSLGMQVAQRNVNILNEKGTNMSGTDFLGQVTAKATFPDVKSRIVATFPITPSGYPGTRVSQLSENWERYKFNSLNIRYVPSVPTTVACQFVLYIDTDPNDDPTIITDADALIRQAVSQTGSQQWNFSVPADIPLARRNDKELYYTGVTQENKRFSMAGIAYIIQITAPVDLNGAPVTQDLVCGSLFLDWNCYFETAQINPEAVQSRIVMNPQLHIVETETLDLIAGQTMHIGHLQSTSMMQISLSYLKQIAQQACELKRVNSQGAVIADFANLTSYPIVSVEMTVVDSGDLYLRTNFTNQVRLTFTATSPIVFKQNAFVSDIAYPRTTPPLELPHQFLSAAENLAISDDRFKPNFADKIDDVLDSTDVSHFQIGLMNTIKMRHSADPDCLNCGRCCPPIVGDEE